MEILSSRKVKEIDGLYEESSENHSLKSANIIKSPSLTINNDLIFPSIQDFEEGLKSIVPSSRRIGIISSLSSSFVEELSPFFVYPSSLSDYSSLNKFLFSDEINNFVNFFSIEKNFVFFDPNFFSSQRKENLPRVIFICLSDTYSMFNPAQLLTFVDEVSMYILEIFHPSTLLIFLSYLFKELIY
jgi:hypothetical protein